jgi:hypothetical protein
MPGSNGDGVTFATFFQMAKCWYCIQSQRNPKVIRWYFGYLDFWFWQPNIQKPNIQLSKWTPNGFWMKNPPHSLPSYTTCFHLSKGSVGQLYLRRWPRHDAMGTLTCISATLHNVVGVFNHDDWHLCYTSCYGRCRYGQRLAENIVAR